MGDFSIIFLISGFISGIFLYYSFPSLFYILSPFAISLPFLKYSKKLSLFIFFIIAGIVISFLHSKGDISEILKLRIEEIEGVILSKYKDTQFSSGYVVRIKKMKFDGKEEDYKGKFLLEIRGKKEIERGRIVQIKNVKFKKISPPKNPGDIDFRNYWKRKKIFFECEGDICLKGYSSPLSFLISRARERIKSRIDKYFMYHPEEKKLIETITIGKERIPRFLKELGIKTGTYHLLVISGIHLSFILLFLKILFLPFQQINNTHPKLFPSLSLLFLWLYAEITGFRVPVIRAVLMFTFFFLGELFERNIDGISSIIMAAFTFLLFSPSSIFDVSFQLSFFATLGIVFFYRKFKKFFQKKVIFSAFLMTVSAQIFVFPLIIYHFGNFSIGGIFNNIIFVPFTGIIVIFSFIFFFLPFFSNFIKFLLSFYLKSLVYLSSFSPLIHIPFSFFSLLFSYIIIFLFISGIRRKFKFLLIFFLFILLILFPFFHKKQQVQIYFFSTKNPFVLIKSENKAFLFLPDSIKERRIERILKFFLRKERIKEIEGISYTTTSFDSFGTYKVLSKFLEVKKVFEFEKKKCFQPYVETFFPGYIKKKREDKSIDFDGLKIKFLEGGFIIKKGKVDILIFPFPDRKSFEKLAGKKFDVVYSKNEKFLNKIKSIYWISGKRIRRKETRERKFYTYKGTVVINLSKHPFDISYLYR